MIKIIRKALPHTPASENFAHPEVRKVVQLLMENIMSLKMQIEDLQSAIQELQGR